MTTEIKDQIMLVRDTGATNMFSIAGVQRVADELELFELVDYLADRKNQKQYATFILTGKEEA